MEAKVFDLPIPPGEMDLELSPSSTISADSEIEKDFTPTVIEVESSDEEVEIVAIVLTTMQEIEKMRGEERYGHLYRVQDRQDHIENRLRDAFRGIGEEDAQARKARRRSFQEAVYGKSW